MNDTIYRLPYHLEPGNRNEVALSLVEYQLAQTPWFAAKRSDLVAFAVKAVPELLAARWRR